ncbi:MAG: exodeoxyribonuclease VII large subunit, partial [Anaerolineae bacterium]
MLDALLSGAMILSVGELTTYLRSLLRESLLQDVWVRGEVSNTSLARSGHLFFSLKDESALVKCVVWSPASQRVRKDVVDGQEVVARGRLDLYPPQGVYQLYVEHVIPVGVGLAYLEFERVKRLLEAEGLFSLERKRPLPRYPVRVGVVTSAYGAALRDIQNVMAHRWPAAELVLAHAGVQGDGAAEEIAEALRSVCAMGVDVVILARGGGAKEDLSCFNDERVARAIAAAPVPVVTGVGHETDFTIADFVADLRAPTPSAAAAAVVPDREEVAADIGDLGYRL